jgi:hypothetical protein
MCYLGSMPDTPKPQADKFRDLARDLEADEDEAAFDEKLKRIVKTPPRDEAKD